MKRPLAYVTAAWRGGECEVMLSNFIYAHSRQVTFENIVDNHCVIFFWHELVIDLRVPKRCSVGDIVTCTHPFVYSPLHIL